MRKRIGQTTERISPATFRRERVSALGRREPATVLPSSSLADAIAAMQAGETRSVLVTDADGRLLGVFTERDVLLRVLGRDADTSAPIERFMTPEPRSVRLDSALGDAIEIMERGGFNGLPVVDDEGRVAGHLDARDVLEYIAEAFPQEVLNLPRDRISCWSNRRARDRHDRHDRSAGTSRSRTWSASRSGSPAIPATGCS